jgi:hypothetical protein
MGIIQVCVCLRQSCVQAFLLPSCTVVCRRWWPWRLALTDRWPRRLSRRVSLPSRTTFNTVCMHVTFLDRPHRYSHRSEHIPAMTRSDLVRYSQALLRTHIRAYILVYAYVHGYMHACTRTRHKTQHVLDSRQSNHARIDSRALLAASRPDQSRLSAHRKTA